ncbi:hypothetical protein LUZ61_012292 [Rhynchospora tenuis]|uniref:Uncharacterized protein n=1 Tax=Rhynchospora tenuis TaxID=198213 RepID=A0AAD6A2L6_9POAL|nr:hypothetical protein LUZ61_012292 [Rhynchospora tenuis]
MTNLVCSIVPIEPSNKRVLLCNVVMMVVLLSSALLLASSFLTVGFHQLPILKNDGLDSVKLPLQDNCQLPILRKNNSDSGILRQPDKCQVRCKPAGSEPLPKGIVSRTSDLEMEPSLGSHETKSLEIKKQGNKKASKSLLAIPVGIKQKEIVNSIVSKFPSSHFVVMLFHYDGVVDKWRDLHWSDGALHVSAINQTKWWFAKRFLHPDIVAAYDYIFLWDEDLGVENFHPLRYISIVNREGLEISQPALDLKSQFHHRITARSNKGDVHRRMYKSKGGGRCYENSTRPPCTGWVEMMAPVFSRAAWQCVWHLIQNDLIYAWGLDYKLGYCAQGDRTLNVGVVDSEYVFHKGIPTLGGNDKKVLTRATASKENDRLAVRLRSYAELKMFNKRWNKAAKEDECWVDPYPEPDKA